MRQPKSDTQQENSEATLLRKSRRPHQLESPQGLLRDAAPGQLQRVLTGAQKYSSDRRVNRGVTRVEVRPEAEHFRRDMPVRGTSK